MENIRVDRESGKVILLQVLNEARPGLHRQGTSRILRRVLEKYDGAPITKMRVNSSGNPNMVGTLEACVYLLDNIPGAEWDKWRQESAYEFKKALIEHVEKQKSSTLTSLKTSSESTSMDVQSDPEGVEVETKTQLMQKHLQAANIFGNIRVVEETGMASAIDAIRLTEPGVDAAHAGKMILRLLEQEERDAIWGQDSESSSNEPTLKSRIFYVQINGKGRVTPVADAKTIVEIMWMLPSKAARAFRRKSAGVVCQALGGDMSLCKEIEERHYRLQSTEEGQKFQKFMTGTGDNMEITTKFGPSWFELASDEEKKAYVSVEAKKSVFNSELQITKSYVDALEMVGQPLDDRDKIEVADRIKDSHRRAFKFLPATETSIETSTTTSTNISSDSHAQLQVCNAIDTSTGLPLATPKCPLSVRGSETSIPLEAAKLNVRVGERSGLVGRETRKLYGIRYGQEASRNIPKRSTIFRGKPWSENTYFSRDSDLIQRAIRNICGC